MQVLDKGKSQAGEDESEDQCGDSPGSCQGMLSQKERGPLRY